MQRDARAAHTIHVCTSCRHKRSGEQHGPLVGGAQLLDELSEKVRGRPALRIVGFACLSVCERPCAVAFSAPGKTTYVFGNLDPLACADDIVQTADLYTQKPDGMLLRKERAPALQAAIVARVPAAEPA